VFKLPSLRSRSYIARGRLEDVLALIQVLALDEHSHRSDNGLAEELQGAPSSARTWTEVARLHPEFFRVARSGNHVVSLVARHVGPKVSHSGRKVLDADFVGRLLSAAIELHDRQVRREERWVAYIPLLVALIAAIGAWIAAVAQ
jgi:hypothetical protein